MKTMMMTVWQDLSQCHLEDILAVITDPHEDMMILFSIELGVISSRGGVMYTIF